MNRPGRLATRLLLPLIAGALTAAACSGGGADTGATAAPSPTGTSTSTPPVTTAATAPTTGATTLPEAPADQTPVAPPGSPFDRHGPLVVCEANLCDARGNAVQLRGLSTHGLQWFGSCQSDAALDLLAEDWRADVVRVAMYVQEGGYETDPEGFTDQVDELIDRLSDRGLYVIVDFHLLSPGDPVHNQERATTFFAEILRRQGHRQNLIYEIANEPNGVPWARIKAYATAVLPAIRAVAPDAPVVVGTRGWSSLGASEGAGPQEIVEDPITDDGVLYAFHFYAGSHHDWHLDQLEAAAAALPVFVTEFGLQEHTGEGADDLDWAQRYLDLMDREQISWVMWNWSDDHRSGAVWQPGTCAADGPWTDEQLKPSGRWVRDQLVADR